MKESTLPLQNAVLDLVEADTLAMHHVFSGTLQDLIFKHEIPKKVNDSFHVAVPLTDDFTMDVFLKKIPTFSNPFAFIFGKETSDDSKSCFLFDLTISGQSPSSVEGLPYLSVLRLTMMLSYANDELFIQVPSRKVTTSAASVVMFQGEEAISPAVFYQEMENYEGFSFTQFSLEILEIIENLMEKTYQKLQTEMDSSIEKFLYSNLYQNLLDKDQYSEAHAVHHMYLKGQ